MSNNSQYKLQLHTKATIAYKTLENVTPHFVLYVYVTIYHQPIQKSPSNLHPLAIRLQENKSTAIISLVQGLRCLRQQVKHADRNQTKLCP